MFLFLGTIQTVTADSLTEQDIPLMEETIPEESAEESAETELPEEVEQTENGMFGNMADSEEPFFAEEEEMLLKSPSGSNATDMVRDKRSIYAIIDGTIYYDAADGIDGAGGSWNWDGNGNLVLNNFTSRNVVFLNGPSTITINGNNTILYLWQTKRENAVQDEPLIITGPGVLNTNGSDYDSHKGIMCGGSLHILDTHVRLRAALEGIEASDIEVRNSELYVFAGGFAGMVTCPVGIMTWGGESVLFDNSDVTVELKDPGTLVAAGSIELKNCHIVEDNLDVYDIPYGKFPEWKMQIYTGNNVSMTGGNNTTIYMPENASFLTIKRGDKERITPVPTKTPEPMITPNPVKDDPVAGGSFGKAGSSDKQDSKIPQISYRTHVQTYGWQDWKKNGEMSGTQGQSKRLEAINIQLTDKPCSGGIEYRTHVQTYGWQGWVSDGAMAGTSGQSKRLEAIQIRLTGDMANRYDVYYQTHIQRFGWSGWAKNGEQCGSAGYGYRLEGIRILLVRKGQTAPASTGDRFYQKAGSGGSPVSKVTGAKVGYNTHVQTYGWQNYVYDGGMAGTSGQSKRLEGIHIELVGKPYSGDIVYRTHVQKYGWQDWKKNGEMSGTSGQAKRLEGIEIKLTGEMAKHYDVYYRVHAQTYGWLGWAKNGEMAGTSGLSKRLEGINIQLVPKGGKAPGSTARSNVIG